MQKNHNFVNNGHLILDWFPITVPSIHGLNYPDTKTYFYINQENVPNIQKRIFEVYGQSWRKK